MTRELVSQAKYHDLARAGRAKGVGVAATRGQVVRAYEDSRRVRFCFSDDSVDRLGDRISATGWVLDAYLKNPTVLWAHESSQPPIGRASNLAVEGNRLCGDVEFAPAEVHAFADVVFKLVRAGFIRAGSVGFVPLEKEWCDDADRPGGIDFKKCELIEFSIVPVPANANALVAARRIGIDTAPIAIWAGHALDGGGIPIIPQSQLEAVRKMALGGSGTRRVGRTRTTLESWVRRFVEPAARAARVEQVRALRRQAVQVPAPGDAASRAERRAEVRRAREEANLLAEIAASDQHTIAGRRATAAALRRFRPFSEEVET